MKKLILILLLFPFALSAQVPSVPFAFWKTEAAGGWTSPADSAETDSVKGWYVSEDVEDSSSVYGWPNAVAGDTIGFINNRAAWLTQNPLGHLYQTTDDNKPIYQSGDSTVLVFDGTNDWIGTTDGGPYAQPNTIFYVFRRYKPAAGTSSFYDGGGTGASGRHAFYSDGTQYKGFAGAVGNFRNTTISPDSVYVVTMVWNGASTNLRFNGIDFGAANVGSQVLDGFYVNTYSGAANQNVGVDEIIVSSKEFDAYKIRQYEEYLATKHGASIP